VVELPTPRHHTAMVTSMMVLLATEPGESATVPMPMLPSSAQASLKSWPMASAGVFQTPTALPSQLPPLKESADKTVVWMPHGSGVWVGVMGQGVGVGLQAPPPRVNLWR
jgi:hypothetical protein